MLAAVNLGKTADHFQSCGSGFVLIPFYSIIYARGDGGGRNIHVVMHTTQGTGVETTKTKCNEQQTRWFSCES